MPARSSTNDFEAERAVTNSPLAVAQDLFGFNGRLDGEHDQGFGNDEVPFGSAPVV